jgi:conjugative relaxase-like TrwC/TraI family protein
MLTSANVTANMAASYYAADNYYTAGEVLSPAVWTGTYAKELGLEGQLDPRNFEQMLRGFGPDGKPLIDRPEYPSVEKRVLTKETKAEILGGIQALLDESGVAESLQGERVTRALTRKLEQGELSAKSVKTLTTKIARVLESGGKTTDAESLSRSDAVAALLSKASAPTQRRAALDLTLSAPKSVSLQALVFGDTRLVTAHREAVEETLRHVETHFAQCRAGSRKDRTVVVTGKLAIARFEHDLSREKDPHLHTHNVVINMTPEGGKVRALHNDELFQSKRMLGTLYRNELALRVKALGYDVQLGKEGTFEIAGFAREQIEAFSKRHQQIWESGVTSQAEAHDRFYEERKAKEPRLDSATLKERWREAAAEHGIQGLPSRKETGAVLGAPAPRIEAEVRALTEKSVSFRVQDLQTARLTSQMGKVPSKEVLAECSLHTADSLVEGHKKHTYTTREALHLEQSYRLAVESGIGTFEPLVGEKESAALRSKLEHGNVLTPAVRAGALQEVAEIAAKFVRKDNVREALVLSLANAVQSDQKLEPRGLLALRRTIQGHLRDDGRRGKEAKETLRTLLDPFEKKVQAMTQGQIGAVCTTAASRDQVVVWQGVAGAGKTFSMARVAELAKEKGYDVRGLAPSAAAAQQLTRETGIPAQTVDSHLLKGEGATRDDKAKPLLWVVDEAGMISAKNFEKIMTQAGKQKARVLLIGDTRQIASVEAGNPFLDLQRQERTTVTSLSESVRQRVPELQDFVTRLYARQAKEAVHGLRRETVEADTREKRCTIAAKAFLAMPSVERLQTLVLAKSNEERKLITCGIREGLMHEGRLGKSAELVTLHALDFTEIQRQQAHNMSVGYVIKPNEDLGGGIRRGSVQVVTQVNVRENALRVKDEDGKERTLACAALVRASLYRQEVLTVAKGDKILWTRNDRRAGALNNDLFEVSKVSEKNVTLRPFSATQGQGHQVLARDGLHHIDHAWAMTVHRSQGQTAKNVILVADGRTSANEFLVGLTRSTQGVLLVAHDKDEIQAIASRSGEKSIAHEVVQKTPVLEHPRHKEVQRAESTGRDTSITMDM